MADRPLHIGIDAGELAGRSDGHGKVSRRASRRVAGLSHPAASGHALRARAGRPGGARNALRRMHGRLAARGHLVGAGAPAGGSAARRRRRLARAGVHGAASAALPVGGRRARRVVLRAPGMVLVASRRPAPVADARLGATRPPRADGLGVLRRGNREAGWACRGTAFGWRRPARPRSVAPSPTPRRPGRACTSGRCSTGGASATCCAASPCAAARVPDARLVLVGDNRTHPRLEPLAIAGSLGIGDRVEWRAYIADDELERLYDRRPRLRLPFRLRGLRDDPARSAGARRALGAPRYGRRAGGLRRAARFVSADPQADGRCPRRSADRRACASSGPRGRPRAGRPVLVGPVGRDGPATRSKRPLVSETAAALDIVIVNYNTRDELVACVQSLVGHPAARPVRIMVVDNASERRQRRGPSRPAGRRSRSSRSTATSGFAAANNLALRAGTAPLVLLLNSDTRVPAGAIDRLIGRLDATGAVAAGPRLVDAAGRPEVSFGPMLSPLAEFSSALRVRARPPAARRSRNATWRAWSSRERAVDWVSGACLLVRRDEASRAGLLRRALFHVRGGRGLLRGPAARRAAACCSRRRPRSSTPAAGRSRQAGRPSTAHYDRSHLAFYEKHAPAMGPLASLVAPTAASPRSRDKMPTVAYAHRHRRAKAS